MKSLIIKSTLGLILVTASLNTRGQSDPSYRSNQLNVLMLNPAQAGANNYNDVSVLGSQSWLGFTGAPRTFTASLNMKLADQLGLGITAFTDQLGPVKSNRGAVNLAYHLKLGQKWRLGLGINGSISSIAIDLPSLSTTQKNDPNMSTVLNSGVSVNAGWGVLAYSEKLYFGVSQPRVGKTRFLETNMTDYVETRGLIAYAGGNFKLNESFDINPNVVMRYVKSFPVYLDVNALFTYKKFLDFGLTYQLNSSVGIILGAEFLEKFYVAYSYALPTTAINRISRQSHEVILRLKFNQANKGGFRGPRFFN
jgi:type IX secretion system PorP/SprF family membrane protein